MRRSNLRPVFKCQAVSTTLCDFIWFTTFSELLCRVPTLSAANPFPSHGHHAALHLQGNPLCTEFVQKLLRAFWRRPQGQHIPFLPLRSLRLSGTPPYPLFLGKAGCRPCDALTEGKTQRTEGLFYGLHRFRGRFCIPGGRKIVIGCALIPQRFGRDKKFVLCHFGQHAARACRNNFPAPASNETIHKLRRSGRSQWGLTEAEFFAVIFTT